MKTKRIHFILVCLIFFLSGYYIGTSKISFEIKNYIPKLEITNKIPPSNVTTADFSLFWNVLLKLQNTYYDKKEINAQKILYGAISGMVQSVGDPYTVFLPPTQNNDFKQGLAGKFEGIGAELGVSDKQIIIVAPLEGSPAQKAGVKAGDAILKVENQPTLGWTIGQAVEKIRGPKGTQVTLTVFHKDSKKTQDLKITRDVITVKSVDGYIKEVKDVPKIKLDKNYANEKVMYLRLSQFGDNTNQEWLLLVNKLALEAKNKIKGVVLDLRNNPGGYLTDATFIASEFIEDGAIVIQEKGNLERIEFKVSRKGLLTDVPVVVLVNKGSASSSEIVAGALREKRGAKLIGETSFGKGTIQQAEDLGNGAGLHVTIAKWLTPNGNWINGKGLEPDIKVGLNEKDPASDAQLEKAVEELVK